MQHREWSRSRYWLIHFLHNRHERLTVDWQSRGATPPVWLVRWLTAEMACDRNLHQWMIRQALRRCGGDPAFVQALRLWVKEEQFRTKLLARLLARIRIDAIPETADQRWPGAFWRALGLRFVLSLGLIRHVLDAHILALVRDDTDDPAMRVACEQLHQDRRAHIAFASERLTLEYADFNFIRRNARRWRLRMMFWVIIATTLVKHWGLIIAVRPDHRHSDVAFCPQIRAVTRFLQAGWLQFRNLLEAMVPYRRDVLLARLSDQQQRPYADARLLEQ